MRSIPIQKEIDIAKQQCETILSSLENEGYTVSPDARMLFIALYRFVIALERKIEIMGIR